MNNQIPSSTSAQSINFYGENPLENINNYPQYMRDDGTAQTSALDAYASRVIDEKNKAYQEDAYKRLFSQLKEVGVNPYQAFFANNANPTFSNVYSAPQSTSNSGRTAYEMARFSLDHSKYQAKAEKIRNIFEFINSALGLFERTRDIVEHPEDRFIDTITKLKS